MDDVAVLGPGPGQGPVDADPAQASLDVVGGLVGGQVVEGHGPLGHPTHHPVLARPDSLHGEPLGQRAGG